MYVGMGVKVGIGAGVSVGASVSVVAGVGVNGFVLASSRARDRQPLGSAEAGGSSQCAVDAIDIVKAKTLRWLTDADATPAFKSTVVSNGVHLESSSSWITTLDENPAAV